MKLPLIRRRPHPGAPWGEWYQASSIDEFDSVLLEEHEWGKDRCAEHQKELKNAVHEERKA